MNVEDALAKYGATAAGLVIGTAAKYGLVLTEGGTFSWRSVLGDMLLLGMLCLVAVFFSDLWGLTGNARVLAGALAAVSADRLIKLLRAKFEARIGQQIDELTGAKS